ncbi:hypothetical protein [Sphingomonas bacterium]|uniref:hypothetical protein n=1 Tax=Sphingomonas bacterium TaxID=1895847 RepID=UPI0020C6F809|nr:hypothetical protein [Sphingomonas bacterium]
MSGGATSGGGQGSGSGPIVHQISFLLSLVAIALGWQFVARLIPADARFAWRDLVLEHWRHRAALQPYLDQRWLWLALHRYHVWFALAALPGTLAIGTVQAVDRRTPWALLAAPLGWGGGCLVGLWLYTSFLAGSPMLAVLLPAIFGYLGGAVAPRLGAWPPRYTSARHADARNREPASR